MNLEALFDQIGGIMTVGSSLLMVASALVMGVLVALVYMFVCRKTGYRKDVVMTFAFIPPIVCAIILLVGNNLVYALSMGGIFTLVRWRSQQTSQQDLTYTLYAVAAGAACGIGFVAYGFLFTVVIGAAMILLDLVKFGENKSTTLRLRVTVPEDLNSEGLFDEVLAKYTSHFQLIEVKTSNFGSLYDMIYMIRLKPEASRKELVDQIRTKNGNLNVVLTLFEIEKRKK
ncbi:MAG: DUF4956 domain-containing protein [Clostridia bacterium]|jgi:hypothetical protein|nr:DUF4956 domain-containing protein [Clostridia bacterium]